jgi:hypothetical protein
MQAQQTPEPGAEQTRLQEDREGRAAWKKWGPYLSERQWGTVREDYSANGDAWNYFSHDQAQYRAYRWGEDGLAGISDNRQLLCFAVALWNGKDPILKERLFGLTNSADVRAVVAKQRVLGERFLYCEGAADLLFTENETNTQRAFNQPNQQPYCKDAIFHYVVKGNKNTVNPQCFFPLDHATATAARHVFGATDDGPAFNEE